MTLVADALEACVAEITRGNGKSHETISYHLGLQLLFRFYMKSSIII